MITTATIGVTLVQAAHLLSKHLTEHCLPEPVAVEVISRTQQSRLTAQMHSLTVPSIAAELLAWAADTSHLLTKVRG